MEYEPNDDEPTDFDMQPHLSRSFSSADDDELHTVDVLKSLACPSFDDGDDKPLKRRSSWKEEHAGLNPPSPLARASSGSLDFPSDGGGSEPERDADEVDDILRASVKGDVSRLLPEVSRAALIERLRTDLFEAQEKKEAGDDDAAAAPGFATPPAASVSPREADDKAEAAPAGGEEKLGTFKGVFLPCLQNILGVILFLRLCWITGQAGALGATGIVLICATSTFLTALSLSAVATNGKVEAGGPYFVISRNLGPEVGTAVGLLFYLGTTIAASMYVLGAVEALYDGFAGATRSADFPLRSVLTALAMMALLAAIVHVGVKQVNAAASVFLSIVLLSVFCLIMGILLFAGDAYSGELGGADRDFFDNVKPNFEEDDGVQWDFRSLLAIFYPSVTGIMAGSNRSGVLATPSKSIPLGTLAAIALTTFLYVVVVWLYGLVVAHDVLIEEKLVVALVAWPSPIIVKLGIIMSCVGAALQSLTGAPRLLAAIASDGALPVLAAFAPPSDAPKQKPAAPPPAEERLEGESGVQLLPKVSSGSRLSSLLTQFQKPDGADVEAPPPPPPEAPPRTASPRSRGGSHPASPRFSTALGRSSAASASSVDAGWPALALTWFVASIPCLAGELNAITPIVTMFFLLMYATVNLSCFCLAYLKSPGFRPTWRYFHWSSALLGFFWCVGLMFTISWRGLEATLALIFAFSIMYYVRKQRISKDWGDAGAGLRFQVARDQLLALTERSTFYHAKNWRPQILVLCRCDRRFNPVKPELLAVAGHLKKGQGLLMAHALIDAGDRGARALVAEAATEVLRLHLQDRAIQGFPRAIVYRANAELPTQTEDALLGTAQSCGVGAMRPNSVLLGWPSKYRGDEVKKGRHGFVRLLRDLSAMRKALIVVKDGASLAGREPFDATRTVDVWWVVQDGGLLLLLPWLLKRSKLFGRCRLRLFAVMTGLFAHHWNAGHGGSATIPSARPEGADPDAKAPPPAKETELLERWRLFIQAMLDDLRIDAEVHPVAGLDFVWAAAHVYRDTLGLRGRTTYAQQLGEKKKKAGAAAGASLSGASTPAALASPSAGAGARGSSPGPFRARRAPSNHGSPLHSRPGSLPDSPGDADADGALHRSPVIPDENSLTPLRGFALALNSKMRRHSARSALIVTNLPYMTHLPPAFFVDYVDSLTANLGAVMLVRGSGQEVVTQYG